ncbi:hypothetical protein Thermo_00538 [Thermoplasmatales archaeon]|nr:hypothetical protein Thermo_00538 [Thermoplasmatales archaeon]
MFESGVKKSDFITTENYYIRLRPETAKGLIVKIQENFNKRYEFRNKHNMLENIVFEKCTAFSESIPGQTKSPDFQIPELSTSRNDNSIFRGRIISIDHEGGESLGINGPTLWYQQKKIKERKPIMGYDKTRVKID